MSRRRCSEPIDEASDVRDEPWEDAIKRLVARWFFYADTLPHEESLSMKRIAAATNCRQVLRECIVR